MVAGGNVVYVDTKTFNWIDFGHAPARLSVIMLSHFSRFYHEKYVLALNFVLQIKAGIYRFFYSESFRFPTLHRRYGGNMGSCYP